MKIAEDSHIRTSGRRIRHKVPPIWIMTIFARSGSSCDALSRAGADPPYPEVMLESLEQCHRMRPGMLDFEGYLKVSGFRL